MSRTITSNDNKSSRLDGLCINGKIKQRTKRSVPVDNPTTEIVTYVVADDNDRLYYVDDFSPKQYYEIGEIVHLPIYVKPYRKKSGDLACSLNVLKPFQPSTKGIAF